MAKKKVRVRSKRLDTLDHTKLSLAVWLLARDLVEDKTVPPSKVEAPPSRLTDGESA
jgi:hypothetical protein